MAPVSTAAGLTPTTWRHAATCSPAIDPGWPFTILLTPMAEAQGPAACADIGGQYPDIDTIYSTGERAHDRVCWTRDAACMRMCLHCILRLAGIDVAMRL